MIMSKNPERQLQELGRLKLPELQARFAEVTGQSSKCPNRTYLIKTILAALQTAARAEPRKRPRKEKKDEDVLYKVLPVRFENDLVEELDEAWRRNGLRTRMQFFRVALSQYLQSLGETEVAAKLVARKAQ
jgi:hypothetical protein